MKRIMIIGFSGSGKSTLARNLGEILGITPTHMDALHWLPNWVESSSEHKINLLKPILQNDSWIIDGSYRRILWEERLEKADTVILLDVNRFTCLKNAILRSIKYKGKTRPDMGEGCTEKFDREFARWVFLDGRKKRKKHIETINLAKEQGKETYIFKNRRQINNWLDSLRKD